MLVLVCLVTSDLYLFYLILLLNPDCNCSRSLFSFSVYKLTTGTYSFVSIILNVAIIGLLTPATAGSSSGSASLVALVLLHNFQTK